MTAQIVMLSENVARMGALMQIAGAYHLSKLGFEFRHTRCPHLGLPGQRGNRFRLLQNQADWRFVVERINRFAIQPKLESACQPLVKIARRDDTQTQDLGITDLAGGRYP